MLWIIIISVVYFILRYSAIEALADICLNLFDTMQITITVTEIQVPPVFNPIQANVFINEENVTFISGVLASDWVRNVC